MSLLSNRFVKLSLGTRAAQASVHSNWSRDQALVRARHTVDPADGLAMQTDEEGGQLACVLQGAQAVLSELKSTVGLKNAPLNVQIVNGLAHFDVVSGDFAQSSERQLQSIAHACVDDMLGEDAGPRVVQWQLQADGQHLLIASLKATVVDALAQQAALHGMALASLQPEFCAHWNAHARHLSGAMAIFASVGDGAVVMALVENGSITALSVGALDEGHATTADGASKTALDLRADRLAASHGTDPAAIAAFMLVAPESDAEVATSRWTAVRHEGGSA